MALVKKKKSSQDAVLRKHPYQTGLNHPHQGGLNHRHRGGLNNPHRGGVKHWAN